MADLFPLMPPTMVRVTVIGQRAKAYPSFPSSCAPREVELADVRAAQPDLTAYAESAFLAGFGLCFLAGLDVLGTLFGTRNMVPMTVTPSASKALPPLPSRLRTEKMRSPMLALSRITVPTSKGSDSRPPTDGASRGPRGGHTLLD